MRNILFFTKKQFAVLLAVGVATGLADHQTQTIEFALAAKIHDADLFNDYLSYTTGGPILGDLLQTWYQWGAILAAYLVRRPAAATVALTINGCCQVFIYANHDPHLLYGIPGLGADIVFAYYGFRRYDLKAVALAGAACALFWYPVVWFTHGLYTYPLSFILPDFAVRLVGSAVMNGFLGAGVGLMVLILANRDGHEWTSGFQGVVEGLRRLDIGCLLAASLATAMIALTYTSRTVAAFFLSIGPHIQAGNVFLEEYNPGYMIGLTILLLAFTLAAFGHVAPGALRLRGAWFTRATHLEPRFDAGENVDANRRRLIRSVVLLSAVGVIGAVGAGKLLGGTAPSASSPSEPKTASGILSVKVAYLGMPLETTGVREESLSIVSPGSLQDLLDVVAERHPLLLTMIPTMIKLVDGVAGNPGTALKDGDEVDFIPATAGG